MSKPVTELYEAALHLDLANLKTLARLDAALDVLSKRDPTNDRALLGVLDLVATSNRLGLVRWVVGMSDLDLNLLGGALTRDTMRLDSPESREHALKVMREYGAAFSGGEGGAKCPECHGAGKVRRVQGGGSIRVVKYDPCPKCTAGAAQAMEASQPEDEIRDLETRLSELRAKIRSYDGGDRPSSPPVRLLEEELGLERQLGALKRRLSADERPATRILPAGKPPPSLRVGMVLLDKNGDRREVLEKYARHNRRAVGHQRNGMQWVPERVVLTWPLAEDFAVEGES